MQLMSIYKDLLKQHGPQKWWPVKRNFKPREWEICVGAILTQNTAWGNVERALDNIYDAGLLTAKDIAAADIKTIKKLIRPSGFFNQKAARLKNFANFVVSFGGFNNFKKNITRKQLLSVNGIGKETADSILLYACNKPYFVIDAYTKRIFQRIGFIKSDGYEEIRKSFEENLPRDIELYKEFHALIVKHAKECCRKVPDEKCILLKYKGK